MNPDNPYIKKGTYTMHNKLRKNIFLMLLLIIGTVCSPVAYSADIFIPAEYILEIQLIDGFSPSIHPTHFLVVMTPMNLPTTPAYRFFCVRLSLITRAFESPNIPLISALGLNPGNRYSSSSRLFFSIQLSYGFF